MSFSKKEIERIIALLEAQNWVRSLQVLGNKLMIGAVSPSPAMHDEKKLKTALVNVVKDQIPTAEVQVRITVEAKKTQQIKWQMKSLFFMAKIILLLFSFQIIYAQQDSFVIDEVSFKQYETKGIEFVIGTKGDKASSNAKETILFIQGSSPRPLIIKDKENYIFTMPFGIKKYLGKYNFIFITQPGIPIVANLKKLSPSGMYLTRDSIPPKEYIENNNLRSQAKRVRDVIRFTQKEKVLKNKTYNVFGHSQGARVAIYSEMKYKLFNKLIVASFNPKSRFHEEVNKYRIDEFLQGIDNSKYIKELYKEYKGLISNKFLDYSYYSYTFPNSLSQMLKIKIPILLIYGTFDVGSSFECDKTIFTFLEEGKNNLTVMPYKNLNHNFFYKESISSPIDYSKMKWQNVFDDAIDWISTEHSNTFR